MSLDTDWVHPFRSEQVSLHEGGRCYRCGADTSIPGRACRDCMWFTQPTDVAAWTVDGLCAQTDPEIFFPDAENHTAATAKAVCAECPVIAECLAYAHTTRATGIWGGTTDGERIWARRKGLVA